MFEWLEGCLTFGFADERPDWIENRLWDELMKWKGTEIMVGSRKFYPENRKKDLRANLVAMISMLKEEDTLQDAFAYMQDLVQAEAQEA